MNTITIPIPPYVTHLLNTFSQAGYQIYIVGGAVRDLILQRSITDWDFTTNATPQQMLALFPNAYYENDFGTVGIINPDDEAKHKNGQLPRIPVYEVTTFRTEHSYSDNRRPDHVEWGTDLNEDLQRRDFTISAMALKAIDTQSHTFELLDPFHGQTDLEQGLVRAVGDPHQRFAEDALRMLRAIRFASQLGFTIETQTFAAIQQHASTLQAIAFERIRDEFFKMLVSPYPDQAIALMFNASLLQFILPELIGTRNVEQSGHHTDDVWTHSVKSLLHTPSQDPLVRFATLIHDIGKAPTRAFVCPKCHSYFKLPPESVTDDITCMQCNTKFPYRDGVVFHNHEMAGARMAGFIADRFRLSNRDKLRLVTLVRWHMFSVDDRQTDKSIRRFIRNVGKENLEDMLALRIGDRLGGGARETSWRLEKFKARLDEVQQQPFAVHDLKIKGDHVMEILKIPPSPRVGEILNQLFDAVVNQQIANEEPALMQKLQEMKSQTDSS